MMKTKSEMYVKVEKRMERKFDLFKKVEQLENNQIGLKEVEKFMCENLKTINKSNFYTSVKALNEVLSNNDINITIKSKDYVNELVKPKDEMLLTKKEVETLISQILNPMDKFIVYALFNGMKAKELITLKKNDIADDYSYININGNKVLCDNMMKRLLKATVRSNTYYKFIGEGDMRSSDSYEMNPKSEYVLRPLPSTKNNDGLSHMKLNTLQRKLAMLSESFDNTSKLTAESLNVSGILYNMFKMQVEEGKIWAIEDISDYLKMNGIKKNAAELYTKYNNRYFDSMRRTD